MWTAIKSFNVSFNSTRLQALLWETTVLLALGCFVVLVHQHGRLSGMSEASNTSGSSSNPVPTQSLCSSPTQTG